MLDSNLKVSKERYEHKTEHDEVLQITQYSNGAYTVFVIEDGPEVYARIVRNDIDYPNIYDSGINIGSTGTLNLKELNKHMEKLSFARDTYIQTLGLREGITIK